MNFIMLYPKMLLGCTAACAVGMAVVMIPSLQSGVWPVSLAIGLIFVMALVRLFGKWARQRTQVLLKLLNSDCRVADFVAESRKMLPQPGKRSRNYVRFNVVSGLLNLGRAEEAEQELAKIDLSVYKNSYEDLQYGMMWHYNRVYAALLTGNAAEAEKRLQAMRTACAEKKLQPLRAGYDVILKQGEIWLKMLRGDYHGAGKVFEEMFELNRNSRLNQAGARYALGQACLHTGKPEKARECWQWAAQNGGDSWYAQKAAQALQEKA